MSDTGNGSEQHDSDKTPFLDFALVVAANLWLLVIVPVLAMLAVIGLSWTATPTYSATARAYLALTPALTDQYVALGKSRPLSEALAKRTGRNDAASLLGHIRVSRDLAILSVEAQDSDPVAAAELANGFVEELAQFTQRLAVTDVSQRRLFFETQLEQVKGKLARAEAALRAQGVSEAAMKKLAESPLDIAARLAGQIAFQEMRLSYRDLKRNYDSGSLVDLRSEMQGIAGLRSTMAKLEEANAAKARGDENRLGALYRDFRLHQTLHELVAQQYEIERFEEKRLIQFIERAQPPERRSRSFSVRKAAEAAIVAFALVLLAVLLRDYVHKLRSTPALAGKLDELNRLLLLRRKDRGKSRR